MSAKPSALAKSICRRFYGDGPAVPLWQIIDDEVAKELRRNLDLLNLLQRDNASMRAEIHGEQEIAEVREAMEDEKRQKEAFRRDMQDDGL